MSATLEAENFQSYFDAPLMKVPERLYPMEIFYTKMPKSDFYYCYIDLDFVKFILGVAICLTNNLRGRGKCCFFILFYFLSNKSSIPIT